MSSAGRSGEPPRLAEFLLRLLVGRGALGRSILGDAREEYAARGQASPRLRLWYWMYVVRFALAYRSGGSSGARRARRTAGSAIERAGYVVQAWRSDLRRSLLSLLQRPAISGAVVVTLMVGIGTTTLAFALVDGVLLRPLPFPAPRELVDISRVDPAWYGASPTAAQAGNVFATPAATFFDWQRAARSFTDMGAYGTDGFTLTGDGPPERIAGAIATSGVFRALGVPAALGRHLRQEDDEIGAEPVIVLSRGLWARRFGADPSVVGRTVLLDGEPFAVVGIMPGDFAFPDESTEFWVSFSDHARTSPVRNGGYLHAIARLAQGVTLEQARGEMSVLQEGLARTYADEAKFRAVVYSRHELTVAAARSRLLMLLGATSIVLLVGCANVANLLLSRVAERRRELALYAALGAGGGRLAALLVGESTVLALAGGISGLVLGRLALPSIVTAFPMPLPRASEIQMDGRVLLASLAASVLTGLVLGLLPSLRLRRLDLITALRDGGSGSTGGRGAARAHGVLVIAEVALSVLLLSTAGLFVQSYLHASGLARGFDAEDVLVLGVTLPVARAESPDDIRAFYQDLMDRMAAIPGVRSAALGSQTPYSGGYSSPPASIETSTGVEERSVHTSVVTPSYFETMDIPIRRGRGLREDDRAGTAPVVVVSEAMARRFWPGEDPIGRRVRLETEQAAPWHEVVGVAGSVRYSFGAPETVEYYRAAAQSSSPYQTVLLETMPGVEGIAEAAERVVQALEPSVPVKVQRLSERADEDPEYRSARIGAVILVGLAGVATGLAILGVYGVLAYAVTRQTREIGIRVSLGGGRVEILRAVLRRGILMTGTGSAVGLVASIIVASMLRTTLAGIGSINPAVLLVVVVTMMLTGVMACLGPARRALRIDPLVALKEE